MASASLAILHSAYLQHTPMFCGIQAHPAPQLCGPKVIMSTGTAVIPITKQCNHLTLHFMTTSLRYGNSSSNCYHKSRMIWTSSGNTLKAAEPLLTKDTTSSMFQRSTLLTLTCFIKAPFECLSYYGIITDSNDTFHKGSTAQNKLTSSYHLNSINRHWWNL